MSSESLSEKQDELAILRPIIEEYTRYGRTERIQIDLPSASSDSPMNTDNMSWVQEYQRINNSLERLETKGMIKIASRLNPLDGIRISIIQPEKIVSLFNHLDESIPSQGNLPRIVYSLESGKGKINGIPFKLYRKKDNRKLFRKLLTSPKYRLSRSEAMKVVNLRTSVKDPDGVNDFSKKVSKLRAGLRGISKDHLRYEKHILQLNADVKLTDKNR